MYSLGIGKTLTVWKGRKHKVWCPQESVTVPHNMKHNILLMHKGCSELSSRLFFTYFKVKSSAVPQPSPSCMVLSWKEEAGQEKE